MAEIVKINKSKNTVSFQDEVDSVVVEFTPDEFVAITVLVGDAPVKDETINSSLDNYYKHFNIKPVKNFNYMNLWVSLKKAIKD